MIPPNPHPLAARKYKAPGYTVENTFDSSTKMKCIFSYHNATHPVHPLVLSMHNAVVVDDGVVVELDALEDDAQLPSAHVLAHHSIAHAGYIVHQPCCM